MNNKHTAHDVDWVAIAEGVHVLDCPVIVRDQVGPGKHRMPDDGPNVLPPGTPYFYAFNFVRQVS